MSSSATTPYFTLHESAQDPDAEVWFVEPAGFTTIPLDVLLAPQDSPAAEKLRTALAPLLDAAPSELARQQLSAQLAAAKQLLEALSEAGTVHCSVGLHRNDVGDSDGDSEADESIDQPLLSLLTLSWRDIAPAPPAITAARAVASSEEHTRVEYVELPCGPASVSETVRTPSAGSGLPQQPLLQIHAHLPHPDGKRLAILTLTTAEVARREQYRAILGQVAELVSFDDPVAAPSARLGHSAAADMRAAARSAAGPSTALLCRTSVRCTSRGAETRTALMPGMPSIVGWGSRASPCPAAMRARSPRTSVPS